MDDSAALPPLGFSTDQLPPRERFDAWRELFGAKIARVDVGTPDKAAFRADIRVMPLPALTFSKNVIAPVSLMRTPIMLRDGDADLTFVICLEGCMEARFGDERAEVRPGQGMLLPHSRLGGLIAAEATASYSLRLDRKVARGLVPSLEAATLRPTAPADPAVALLRGYCDQLAARAGGLPAALAALAGDHLHELLAHILNPVSELARACPGGGLKAARLRAALDDVAEHLSDPVLSAAAVGARLGLSERYVQRLIDEGTGVSFSQHVRNLRLDRARRLLRDPRSLGLRITDIAYAAGFQDLSYFNREFRRRFGETPSAARSAR